MSSKLVANSRSSRQPTGSGPKLRTSIVSTTLPPERALAPDAQPLLRQHRPVRELEVRIGQLADRAVVLDRAREQHGQRPAVDPKRGTLEKARVVEVETVAPVHADVEIAVAGTQAENTARLRGQGVVQI